MLAIDQQGLRLGREGKLIYHSRSLHVLNLHREHRWSVHLLVAIRHQLSIAYFFGRGNDLSRCRHDVFPTIGQDFFNVKCRLIFSMDYSSIVNPCRGLLV